MEVNQTGAELQVAQANLEAELEKWKHRQEMKAMFNFFKAYAGMVVGITQIFKIRLLQKEKIHV